MKRKDIPQLNNIQPDRYENLFTIGMDQEGKVFYNLTDSAKIEGEIPIENIAIYQVPQKMSWHNIQYDIYGSMNLWWLIFLTNPELNPIRLPEGGTKIKVLRKELVPYVLKGLNS